MKEYKLTCLSKDTIYHAYLVYAKSRSEAERMVRENTDNLPHREEFLTREYDLDNHMGNGLEILEVNEIKGYWNFCVFDKKAGMIRHISDGKYATSQQAAHEMAKYIIEEYKDSDQYYVKDGKLYDIDDTRPVVTKEAQKLLIDMYDGYVYQLYYYDDITKEIEDDVYVLQGKQDRT